MPTIKQERDSAKLTIIIPAAGSSRRMRSYGAKSLIELTGGENVLGRQLRLLRKQFPKAEFIVVVGFQSEKVLKYLQKEKTVKVVENDLYEQTSVVRSIDLGLKIASHPNILIVYGDLVFNQQTISHLTKFETSIIIDTNDNINKDEVGVTISNEACLYFAYGLDTKWAQILMLTGKELEMFKEIITDKIKRKLQTFEILNQILDHGGKIKVVSPSEIQMVEVDTYADIEKARALPY
jgi:choline kinase